MIYARKLHGHTTIALHPICWECRCWAITWRRGFPTSVGLVKSLRAGVSKRQDKFGQFRAGRFEGPPVPAHAPIQCARARRDRNDLNKGCRRDEQRGLSARFP